MNNLHRMTLMSGLVFGAIGTTAPLITLYLQELGASFSQISLILTSYAAILIVSNYVWGRLLDRLQQRKFFIVGGLVSMAITLNLLSRVPDANWAWAVRLLEAISMAAYLTASLALMGDLLQQAGKRGRQMGIYRGIGSVAFAIGAIIGGRLADYFSISTAIAFATSFYAASAFVALTLQEFTASVTDQMAEQEDTSTVPTTSQPPYQRPPLLFLAGVFFWVGAHGASASMWPNYMADLGYSKTATSSLWGLAALVEGIGMPLVGNLSDTVGRIPLLVAGGFGITLVQIGYITLAHRLPALMGVQVIRGFGFASYTTSAMTFTAELGNKHIRGNNSGTFNAASSCGQLLGAMAGGNLVQFTSFETMFTACACTALTSALCFTLLHYQQRKSSASIGLA